MNHGSSVFRLDGKVALVVGNRGRLSFAATSMRRARERPLTKFGAPAAGPAPSG
jgi:hypothetical protein